MFIHLRETTMKILSPLLLVIFAIATLTACDGGQGPKKPTNSTSTRIFQL
ncbi:hypothetical protein CRENPOLYSF2_2000005 [Crenothrix polyspora]|jgi:hypothetical protein|uniref:Uncharacterized protein n=1 Tax=Crenothrix polyspora TaxID=360316 RepID=A0A1R4H5F4_9GAMM|nr:hypothetical protein CRENPOLYSF2_2000005 [Crenothrix polyspora]